MEAPNCRLCGTKHWSRERCPALEVKVGKVVTSTPLMRRVAAEVKKIEAKKPAVKIAEGLRDAIAVANRELGCPVCAARKAQHAARMKRYRAKKLT